MFIRRKKAGGIVMTSTPLAFVAAIVLGALCVRAGPSIRRTRVRVVNGAASPPYDPSRPLRVLSWNLQYCAGTERHFFYDGGRAVATPRKVVRSKVREIADAVKAADADIVLLQEVDRRSLRTGLIDEHRALLRALEDGGCGYSSHCSAWYWRVPWVPAPRWRHVGLINMHLSVFSRFRLNAASRVRLPLLQESRVRRMFNLRRCVLHTGVDVADGRVLELLNTHLSAFSRGDGTLEKQVDILRVLGAGCEAANSGRWLLAGDFNSLPPGVDASRTLEAAEAALYSESASPIEPLYAEWTPVLPPDELAAGDGRAAPWHTYKPFQACEADRTIDHAFVGSGMRVLSRSVLTMPSWPSDHLPVLTEVELAA